MFSGIRLSVSLRNWTDCFGVKGSCSFPMSWSMCLPVIRYSQFSQMRKKLGYSLECFNICHPLINPSIVSGILLFVKTKQYFLVCWVLYEHYAGRRLSYSVYMFVFVSTFQSKLQTQECYVRCMMQVFNPKLPSYTRNIQFSAFQLWIIVAKRLVLIPFMYTITISDWHLKMRSIQKDRDGVTSRG